MQWLPQVVAMFFPPWEESWDCLALKSCSLTILCGPFRCQLQLANVGDVPGTSLDQTSKGLCCSSQWKKRASCLQGAHWSVVSFPAYYFKAVFLALAWQARWRHLAPMIKIPLFSRKLTINSSGDPTRKGGSFWRANMLQRRVDFH